jgi:hypothetical protein
VLAHLCPVHERMPQQSVDNEGHTDCTWKYPERPLGNPTAGSVYYWSLLVVFITATIASILRWDENYHLFILGVLAFAAASLGRTARRQRWPAWVTMHISGMGTSYVQFLSEVDPTRNSPSRCSNRDSASARWSDSLASVQSRSREIRNRH